MCYFCKESGHFKKDYPKRKKWFENTSIFYMCINFESNLFEVPNNNWWLCSNYSCVTYYVEIPFDPNHKRNWKVSLHGKQNEGKNNGHWNIQINLGHWVSCRFQRMSLCT